MPHISYSELKNWIHCPFYHDLNHIQKVLPFDPSPFTAFGQAAHKVAEEHVFDESLNCEEVFKKEFETRLNEIDEKTLNESSKLIEEMFEQGNRIARLPVEALKEKFPGYEVISSEEELFEPIEIDLDGWNFKGFIDLVIKTPDGKYHLIDWKTCSWGWKLEKKTDKVITYQLTLYKKFFCEKHGIDPKMIETYFGLIKRTAKRDRVEIFRVTSGPKKTKNALKILNNAIYNINKGNKIKNLLNCNICRIRNSKWCP